MLAIPFPPLSPELFSIEIGSYSFALRWYALAYLFGLGIGWWVIWKAMARPKLWPQDTPPLRTDDVEGLLTAVVLGVILGGRIGYVLFYLPDVYADDPLAALRIWEGGMSFHGGLAGVALAAFIYCRKKRASPLQIADAMSMVIGIGLLLGRLANFVNAELWGRPTDAPWGVIFPGIAAQDCPGPVGITEYLGATVCARHPSQLYEALLEGLLMGAILLWLAWRRGWLKRPGALTGMFFLIYGASRFTIEFFRQPDDQFTSTENPIGFALALSPDVGLTMGQILTIPMLLLGTFFVLRAKRVS